MKKSTIPAYRSLLHPLLYVGSTLLLTASSLAQANAGHTLQTAAQLTDAGPTAAAIGNGAPTTPTIYHLYVVPTGNDTNSGSIGAPFRTIAKAASMAKPSTTIHVAPGDYSGNVATRTSGAPAARIRYVSDTRWGARILGTGSDAHWTNSGDFVDISGFDISGPGRLGILNNASNTLIEGNHVHDLQISGGCNGAGGGGIVNAAYDAADDDVIGNVVHDIGVPGKCNGVQGIYHSNLRGKIMNNIVYRVSAWGIHLWHAANNVVIANNTVFNNGSNRMGGGIAAGSGDSPGGIVLDNTTIMNNIVYGNPGASIEQFCYAGVGCIGPSNTTANNLVYGNGAGIRLRVGGASGTVTADPRFVNYQPDGSGNYRLQSSSPAIDRALIMAAPAYDMDNVARPLGGAADIGAYESF